MLGCYLYGFPTEYGLKDVKVYNNIHYFGKGKGNRIFVEGGRERIPIETEFKNNIFYFEDKAEWGFDPDETCVFENNLFCNVSPKGENALTDDPMLINPGFGGTNIDMTDPNRLSDYRPKDGSPAIGSGKKIENNGGMDFGGNEISGTFNIGAF